MTHKKTDLELKYTFINIDLYNKHDVVLNLHIKFINTNLRVVLITLCNFT